MNDETFEADADRMANRRVESYRPGNGEPPDVDVRGYVDPAEGEMTVLTLGFNVTALEIHLNRDWLACLEAMIDGVEHQRRVARGMAIVRRILQRNPDEEAGDGR